MKHVRNHSNSNTSNPQRLFTCITRTKRQEQQKMVRTNDTEHHDDFQNVYVQIQAAIHEHLNQFKLNKAKQIAQVSLQAGSEVKTVMRRLRPKFNQSLLEALIQGVSQVCIDSKRSAIRSVQRGVRSPKQLGSTIEHTFTPQSVDTPAFDFQSQDVRGVKQFSIKSNQFTLNPNSNSTKRNNKAEDSRMRIVSEFNVGHRNPTSKRIKDRIMNSKKYAN